MILVAGGTGCLGRAIVELLAHRPHRILTRNPTAPEHVRGDVRDRASLDAAMAGVRAVVSAMHGFVGKGLSPDSVDRQGNENLIDAARGCERFILLSVRGAAPDHPMDLFRAKYAAEQRLIASGVPYTIVRPTAFVETWLQVLGAPLLTKGKTTIFGRGQNPINFVSVVDVARVVVAALDDPGMAGRTVDVAGPSNISFDELVDRFQTITGATGKRSHVPLPVMRASAWLTRPFSAALARMIRAGVVMDTTDMTCASQNGTSVDDAIRRVYPRV